MNGEAAIARIEAAIGQSEFDRIALEATADVVGNDRGVWIRHAAQAGATMLLAPFMSSTTLSIYARDYAPMNPYVPYSARLAAGTVIRTSTVIPLDAHRESAYFAWADKTMGAYELALIVSTIDDSPLIVSFGRSRARGDFTRAQEARMRSFGLHLRRAYFLHSRISHSTGPFRNLLTHAVDTSACFALARDGLVLEVNVPGDLELREASTVALAGGHIRFGAPSIQRAFVAALRSGVSSAAFRIDARRPDSSALLVNVRGMSMPAATRPAEWLLFVPASRRTRNRLRLDNFCIDHNLTSREVAVLELLVEGRDTDDIASLLGHSVETTRTVLKALFHKTRTRRQTELVLRALD